MVAESSQSLAASFKPGNFQYERLTSIDAKPSIRLAVLEPGTRQSSIRLKLVHTTFADRPKYEALSYTWGGQDAVKNIVLNGTRVDIRENLWLALVHLRYITEERLIWIDAICINQSDVEERNQQVQMMAFIYSRAQNVLVWLGVIRVPEFTLLKSKAQYEHEKLDAEIIHLLTVQPYWSRIWIVQEIGSATGLEIHWGLSSILPVDYDEPRVVNEIRRKRSLVHSFVSKSESWDEFFSQVKDFGNGASTLAQRKGRHGDDFLLANLIEACKMSKCEEPRDKAYGFVGIAHDCQDGEFLVDYSKSLFELYEDLIRFYARSEVNSKSIVYFSQLMQQMFGGPMIMHQDLERSQPLPSKRRDKQEHGGSNIRVIGQYYGTISLVGPSYNDYIALPQVTRQWKAALSRKEPRVTGYERSPETQKAFLERLRASNETLTKLLYDISPSNLSKQVTSIAGKRFWDGTESTDEMTCFAKTEIRFAPAESGLNPWEDRREEPRLFCTDEEVVGLIPPGAQRGDALFVFHKSNIVAIVRQEIQKIGPCVRLIGRALAVPGKMSPDELEKVEISKMKMDIRILQLLTA